MAEDRVSKFYNKSVEFTQSCQPRQNSLNIYIYTHTHSVCVYRDLGTLRQ